METTATEKRICHSNRSKEVGAGNGMGGRCRTGWAERQREQENMARSLCCGFHRKDQVRRVSRLRIG